MRLMPTSMTVAPGLTQSPLTIRSRPTAAMSTSARRQTAARSRVREWQIVTVALAPEQQLGHRLAEEVRAPEDDRLGALELRAGLLEQQHHAGRRARPQPLAAERERPALTGVRPSTSLPGSIRLGQLDAVEVVGHRELAEDPADAPDRR